MPVSEIARGGPPRLTLEVYHRIRDMILAGDLPPGSPLSRRRLAEEIGVSALPVGAALDRLAAEGFVESRARAGTRVRMPSASEVRGNYVVREALETQAARLFAETATKDEKERVVVFAERLDGMYDRLYAKRRLDPAAQARVEKRHVDFHIQVARATACAELVEAIERSRVLLFNWLFTRTRSPDPLPRGWHSDLAGALVSGTPAEAAEAMRTHVQFRMREVMERFDVLHAETLEAGRMSRGPQRRARTTARAAKAV